MSGLGMKEAVVCGHVVAGAAIRHACRARTFGANDSGWQFFCGGPDEDPFAARMRSIEDVLALEPSLAPLLEHGEGTELLRAELTAPWTVRRSTPATAL